MTFVSGRAVVGDERGGYAVHDVEVDSPGPGEVLGEVRASGVCHTDHDLAGRGFSLVLGHEGAGVVAEVGGGSRSRQGLRGCRSRS
ncbi:MAG: alcohol dehydrogenase catalytic domain-containing protein [Pseudonocardiaceae bacterium]